MLDIKGIEMPVVCANGKRIGFWIPRPWTIHEFLGEIGDQE